MYLRYVKRGKFRFVYLMEGTEGVRTSKYRRDRVIEMLGREDKVDKERIRQLTIQCEAEAKEKAKEMASIPGADNNLNTKVSAATTNITLAHMNKYPILRYGHLALKYIWDVNLGLNYKINYIQANKIGKKLPYSLNDVLAFYTVLYLLGIEKEPLKTYAIRDRFLAEPFDVLSTDDVVESLDYIDEFKEGILAHAKKCYQKELDFASDNFMVVMDINHMLHEAALYGENSALDYEAFKTKEPDDLPFIFCILVVEGNGRVVDFKLIDKEQILEKQLRLTVKQYKKDYELSKVYRLTGNYDKDSEIAKYVRELNLILNYDFNLKATEDKCPEFRCEKSLFLQLQRALLDKYVMQRARERINSYLLIVILADYIIDLMDYKLSLAKLDISFDAITDAFANAYVLPFVRGKDVLFMNTYSYRDIQLKERRAKEEMAANAEPSALATNSSLLIADDEADEFNAIDRSEHEIYYFDNIDLLLNALELKPLDAINTAKDLKLRLKLPLNKGILGSTLKTILKLNDTKV